MLTRLVIDNFKSLRQLDISFTDPLTVFIGSNAVGKSTILQAIDLLPYLARGEIQQYLDKRNWSAFELRTKPYVAKVDIESKKIKPAKRSITFTTHFNIDEKFQLKWEFSLLPKGETFICIREMVWDESTSQPLLNRDNKKLSWFNFSKGIVEVFPEIQLDSSMLSLININEEHFNENFPQLFALKRFVAGIRSFDLLTPEKMRKTSRHDANDIGNGGERLAAFIHSLSPEKKERINAKLQEYFPFLESLMTTKKQYGYVQLTMNQKYNRQFTHQIGANYLSDGLLRIIAIVSLGALSEDYKAILLDEIEDGINPNLAAELVEYLKEIGQQSKKQLFVTTHSPVILNYFDKESIIFLWRDPTGIVEAQSLFSSPELTDQLRFMNPGEIWLNYETDEIIAALTNHEAIALDAEEKTQNE